MNQPPSSSPGGPTRRSRAVLAAALALVASATCGCKSISREGRAGAGGLAVNLAVSPRTANQRHVTVTLTSSAPVTGAQLAFELPSECHVATGAAVRPVPQVVPGTPVVQEMEFECTTGATGEVKASVTGLDAEGKPLETSATAKF